MRLVVVVVVASAGHLRPGARVLRDGATDLVHRVRLAKHALHPSYTAPRAGDPASNNARTETNGTPMTHPNTAIQFASLYNFNLSSAHRLRCGWARVAAVAHPRGTTRCRQGAPTPSDRRSAWARTPTCPPRAAAPPRTEPTGSSPRRPARPRHDGTNRNVK